MKAIWAIFFFAFIFAVSESQGFIKTPEVAFPLLLLLFVPHLSVMAYHARRNRRRKGQLARGGDDWPRGANDWAPAKSAPPPPKREHSLAERTFNSPGHALMRREVEATDLIQRTARRLAEQPDEAVLARYACHGKDPTMTMLADGMRLLLARRMVDERQELPRVAMGRRRMGPWQWQMFARQAPEFVLRRHTERQANTRSPER